MRRASAWLVLAAITSGCGLTIGIKPGADSQTGSRQFIQIGPEGTGDSESASNTPEETDGDHASGDPDSITGGEEPGASPTQTNTDATSTPETTSTIGATTSTANDDDAGEGDATTTTAVEETTTTTTPVVEELGTVFSDDEAFITHQCDGDGVTIAGDAGDYTLEGGCGTVVITGSFNTVIIEDVNRIDLTGTLNAVVYTSGDPVINDFDGDNIVSAG